jgi:centrin-3
MSSKGASASVAVEQLSEEQCAEIRDTFALCDEDESGTVDARELSIACEALGVEMSAEEREQAVRSSKGGSLDFKSFIELMAPKILARDPNVELRAAFALFDADSKGYLVESDLLRVAQELNDAHPSATASMMWNEFVTPAGANARLTFDQFVAIVTSPAAVSAANQRASLKTPQTPPPAEPETRATRATTRTNSRR